MRLTVTLMFGGCEHNAALIVPSDNLWLQALWSVMAASMHYDPHLELTMHR
jgi:hypothetical protein